MPMTLTRTNLLLLILGPVVLAPIDNGYLYLGAVALYGALISWLKLR
jgi:hypothetical protein